VNIICSLIYQCALTLISAVFTTISIFAETKIGIVRKAFNQHVVIAFWENKIKIFKTENGWPQNTKLKCILKKSPVATEKSKVYSLSQRVLPPEDSNQFREEYIKSPQFNIYMAIDALVDKWRSFVGCMATLENFAAPLREENLNLEAGKRIMKFP